MLRSYPFHDKLDEMGMFFGMCERAILVTYFLRIKIAHYAALESVRLILLNAVFLIRALSLIRSRLYADCVP